MRLHLYATAAISLAVVACSDLPTQLEPPGVGPDQLPAANTALTRLQLMICPTQETHRVRETIGEEGGVIRTRGASITIPADAVPRPTTFEVIVPASRFLEVEIHAIGRETYLFAKPAVIRISYARCPEDATPPDVDLQGVYIDDVTNEVLEIMGGAVDQSNNKVSFLTSHLSGYAVAF